MNSHRPGRLQARALVSILAVLALVMGTSPAIAADDFHTYSGSTPLSVLANGTVLKTRTVQYSLSGIPLPLTVVQLLYRTTDAQGRPSANATSIIQPPASALTGPATQVVAYQSFYDSLNPEDGPSYALAGGNSGGTPVVHAETASVAGLLLAGHPVVMADTQGATADFAAGPEYGRATVDSLRAVLASPASNVSPTAKIGLLGYSGGAIGTNWAAVVAPSYAPDINERLVGAAEGGVLVVPDHNLDYISGSTIWAGVLVMAFVGVSRAYDVPLRDYLNERGRQLLDDLDRAPIGDVLGRYPGLTYESLALPQHQDRTTIEPYVTTVNKLNLGQAPIPTIPMFVGQGTGGEAEGTQEHPTYGSGDGVMLAGDVRSLARRYCDADLPVQYREYPASHVTTVPLWLPEAIAWLEARFDGTTSPPSSCGSIAAGNSLAPLPVPGNGSPMHPTDPSDGSGGGPGPDPTPASGGGDSPTPGSKTDALAAGSGSGAGANARDTLPGTGAPAIAGLLALAWVCLAAGHLLWFRGRQNRWPAL
ncbi:MAG: lipase family protein [Aeromicrobium sp.]|uniref:lipase family protein n=1 Tax=Aeromicrobium sp. TaxID=1871063 RepID=UPI003C3FA075